MGAVNANSKPVLGFLTVLDDPQHGLFGGYLLLTMAGRPLEFHCTAPIKPNRAQEILYGPTLELFLYGEQIGRTLLEQAKTEPAVVCTDCPPALAVRELVSVPVALVLPPETAGDGPSDSGGNGSAVSAPAAKPFSHPLKTFRVGNNTLAVAEPSEADSPLIARRLADLSESFDLAEPFGAFREAIQEAQQAAR